MTPRSYDRILDRVRTARTALLWSDLLKGLGIVTLAAGLTVLALVLADNLFHLPGAARVALLAAGAAGLALVVRGQVLLPARRSRSDDAVAVLLEASSGERENRLINALQLGREAEGEGLSAAVARAVVTDGVEAAGRLRSLRVVNGRAVLRALGLGALAVLLVLAYWTANPDWFLNAVTRYARPAAFVPPLSATALGVEPGDRILLRGEPLEVAATASGVLPTRAEIDVRGEDSVESSEMLFNGREFSFSFAAVDAPFTYRVRAGDAETPWYRVTLTERPEVTRLTLTYAFPAYLGLEQRVEEDATGEVRAPTGTDVTVRAFLSQPVADAALTFGEAAPRTMIRESERVLSGTFRVQADDTWSLVLRTREGLGNRDPVRHRIVAVPDQPPVVEITVPGRDLTGTLPMRVPVTVRATDDHGLAEIALLVRRGDEGDFAAAETWRPEGARELVVSSTIVLGAGDLAAGETVTYRAEARDACPGGRAGVSRSFTIRVLTKEDRAADAARALSDLAGRLRDLLEREQGILRATEDLRSGVTTGELRLEGLPARATAVADEQGRLGADMVGVADLVPTELPALAEVRGALLSLTMNEVMDAVRFLKDSRGRDGPVPASRDLDAAKEAEAAIVARLEELLGKVESLIRRLEEDPDAFVDEKMDEGDRERALRDAIARLKKFIREQEDVLEQTRALEEKDVDDFTEEDLALLEKLAAQESELSRFLEDLKDDLSKIPDQDFSNSTVLKELIEAYSEVELAADALTRKAVELAVPREQSGLELAESLTENIEKWLPDVRDSIKWKMEELDGEYPDVPMADLPEQLEDLMGDLIEEEEQLGEDADDVTSGWADSIDKGAGWGTVDGPISNMSAQGKTGNTLPNQHEVGGRSGEGRSGRSHGEMVEGEATGKGGRKTPTRLTPDPWEGKAVKDRSNDPLGGATGGGKVAGGAGEGLRGPLPPPVKGDVGRLHGNQVAIRQKAERLDRALRAFHYPDEELSRTIVLMKELEEALRRGDRAAFSRQHGVLMEQLRESRSEILDHARVIRDRSKAVPKEMMRELMSVDLGDLPEGYRELLREYYKIRSRGGGK